MKLTLNVWERMMLNIIIGGTQGTAAVMRKAFKVMSVLEMTPEEEKEAELVHQPSGDISWNAELGIHYDLEIKDKEAVNLLRRQFALHDQWKGTQAKQVGVLEAKLGLTPKETDESPE